MKTQQVILTTSTTASGAIAANRFVGFDGAQVTGANGNCLGVAECDANSGEQAPVNVRGIILVEAGAAIAAGAQVGSDASGRAITYAAGRVQGEALDAATAAGQVIRISR